MVREVDSGGPYYENMGGTLGSGESLQFRRLGSLGYDMTFCRLGSLLSM